MKGWECFCQSRSLTIVNVKTFARWRVMAECDRCGATLVITKQGTGKLLLKGGLYARTLNTNDRCWLSPYQVLHKKYPNKNTERKTKMNINDAYSSTYLKTSDLKGRHVPLAIARVTVEDIGGEKKPVLYFAGRQKGMVLNRTNATTIEEITGTPETAQWAGKKIILYPTKVDFQGRRVAAMRIDAPDGHPEPVNDIREDVEPGEEAEEDDISF